MLFIILYFGIVLCSNFCKYLTRLKKNGITISYSKASCLIGFLLPFVLQYPSVKIVKFLLFYRIRFLVFIAKHKFIYIQFIVIYKTKYFILVTYYWKYVYLFIFCLDNHFLLYNRSIIFSTNLKCYM